MLENKLILKITRTIERLRSRCLTISAGLRRSLVAVCNSIYSNFSERWVQWVSPSRGLFSFHLFSNICIVYVFKSRGRWFRNAAFFFSRASFLLLWLPWRRNWWSCWFLSWFHIFWRWALFLFRRSRWLWRRLGWIRMTFRSPFLFFSIFYCLLRYFRSSKKANACPDSCTDSWANRCSNCCATCCSTNLR